MTGLPRTKDETRPQDAFSVMVLGGVESLTFRLMRGDPFSEKALKDMIQLQRRLDAFSNALDARVGVLED